MRLRHRKCAVEIEVDPKMPNRPRRCEKCAGLVWVRKYCVRAGLKKFAAEVLYSKLFEGPQRVAERVEAMKQDVIGQRHPRKLEAILRLKDWELQQWVRSTFYSVRKDSRNGVLGAFMDGIVAPALRTNITAVGEVQHLVASAQSSLEAFLKDPTTAEVDQVRVHIARAALQGKLQGDHLIQGLILTCLRVAERTEACHSGTGTVRGRVGQDSAMFSEHAKALAMEAGRSLALAGGNIHMYKLFGCSQAPLRGTTGNYMAMLEQRGLPRPLLALDQPGRLEDNLACIDQKLSWMTGTHGRRLVLAFDMTYLLQGLSQHIEADNSVFLLGAPWTRSEPGIAAQRITETVELRTHRKATDMLLVRLKASPHFLNQAVGVALGSFGREKTGPAGIGASITHRRR